MTSRLPNVRQNDRIPQLLAQLSTPDTVAEQQAEVVIEVLDAITPDSDLEDMQGLVIGDVEAAQDAVCGAAKGDGERILRGVLDRGRGEDMPEDLDDRRATGNRIAHRRVRRECERVNV